MACLILGLIWVWLKQFVWMMALDDDSFPGKYDELIWSAVFIVFPFLALFAFAMWKNARAEFLKAEREENEARNS
ncbi:MAG: hypothetical protein L0220_23360 [Acidobacteria bacterium]|nr:hypothetical protein [Acidobacteriota bacterium]